MSSSTRQQGGVQGGLGRRVRTEVTVAGFWGLFGCPLCRSNNFRARIQLTPGQLSLVRRDFADNYRWAAADQFQESKGGTRR